MTFRFHVITDCLAGCLISVPLTVLLLLKFESTFIASLPIITIPAFSCWLGGIRRRDSLMIVAVLGLAGSLVGTAITSKITTAVS